MSARPDVFVVGGGPAGLATAIALRRRGLTVTVADGIVPPADKACGEGLLPDTLAALERIGVKLPAADSFAFRGICFVDGKSRVRAQFPRAGRGMRRTTLHRILVEHATASGANLVWGRPVDFDSIDAHWIVGADGEASLFRKRAGLDEAVCSSVRFGFRRHYRIRPWSDFMELYWGAGCQIYVTPISGDAVCVAGMSRDSQARLDRLMRGFPELEERLRGATPLSDERGAASYSRKLRSVARGRVALVGDASGSVDAITGEGLSLAFRQAEALAGALEKGDLRSYQLAHERIRRRPALMARGLLALGRSRAVRRIVLRGLEAAPAAFGRLLSFHVGGYIEEGVS